MLRYVFEDRVGERIGSCNLGRSITFRRFRRRDHRLLVLLHIWRLRRISFTGFSFHTAPLPCLILAAQLLPLIESGELELPDISLL
jgi:hypothetical protein